MIETWFTDLIHQDNDLCSLLAIFVRVTRALEDRENLGYDYLLRNITLFVFRLDRRIVLFEVGGELDNFNISG